MALSLTDAQLKTISDQLFLFQDPNPLRLPPPLPKGAGLAAKMAPIAADPRFTDLSFSVVDFTSSFASPDIWLHNEDAPWQMASTGKLALLLSAVQLRDDVRRVQATGLVSTAADFDELFATIWSRSTFDWVRQIASVQDAPRVSTIFDLAASPIDFAGAATPLDRARLHSDAFHQKWSKVPDLTFWERLWQTGAQSDNVAACTLGSEMGPPYFKAVQRAYQLYEPPFDMRMFLCEAYGNPPGKLPVTRASGAPFYRKHSNSEGQFATDPLTLKRTKWTTQGASVEALTAYMIALMQDKLISTVAADAQTGCQVIRDSMADEKLDTMTSLIFEGVSQVATVTKAHTKLGILTGLRSEFAYLEAAGKKYGVAALGIIPVKVGATRIDQVTRGQELGKAIHNAL
jgi:hypothetical protein